MSKVLDWIDGWQIRLRDDRGYGVYDDHGLVAGPFGTEEAAIQAALLLPKKQGRAPAPAPAVPPSRSSP
ncbi:hypothetical protein [Devosia sp. A16]|uniref:hypothetical protein n=1 Tax=Devosia sp. A16 TaxID=1736675 RepID=UPI0006D81220|nr:hypothetical protein [Devosia sp. A16]